MCSLTSAVQSQDTEIMYSESFDFIRKFCATFELGPDIEFTCYEVYPKYFQRYFNELSQACKQVVHTCHSSESNRMVEILYKTIGDEFTLNTSILIAICTKYIDGFRGQYLFKAIPKFLMNMGCPYNLSQILATEFIVFRCLNFHVSSPALYGTVVSQINRIAGEFNGINSNLLHKGCVKVLRIIYLNRRECDKIVKEVTDHSYHSDGNVDFKLGAAILLCAVKLISRKLMNLVLSEIVRIYYLNESFLEKLTRELLQFISGFNQKQ